MGQRGAWGCVHGAACWGRPGCEHAHHPCPRDEAAHTYHWPLVLTLAHSAGPGASLPLMGLGDLGGLWGLACLVPQASLVVPAVQAPRAPPQCLAVPGSQEGPGGQGVHPCLAGLGRLGPHWDPEGRASPGTLGSLWGPASLWSLCRRALQGGLLAR